MSAIPAHLGFILAPVRNVNVMDMLAAVTQRLEIVSVASTTLLGVIVKIAWLVFTEILRLVIHRHVDLALVWDPPIPKKVASWTPMDRPHVNVHPGILEEAVKDVLLDTLAILSLDKDAL